ncbi:MAG: phosphate ABC transporter permease family protein, partial [Porphyrobacter sp.]|nr:phosphate ABC transporter permease family protein [Porphyrobacter sp.]
MSPITLLLIAIGLALAGWLAGRAKAWSFQSSDPKTRPVARPIYHAWYVALWIGLPVLGFILLWMLIAPQLVVQNVLASPAAQALPSFGFERDAWLAEARAVALGYAPGVFNDGAEPLVEPFRQAIRHYNLTGLAITVLIGVASGAFAFLKLRPDFRARTKVERIVMAILLLASLVAILTTFGIFASLVFETSRFFGMVSPVDFLFGTTWSPDPMTPA